MIATAKDIRFHFKEIMEGVLRGEEIIITYRGKPKAKIVSFEDKNVFSKSDSKNELFGLWKDNANTADVEGFVRNLRKGRFNAD